MLLHPDPQEDLLPAIVDIVRKLAASEHDFVRILVELIADRRDPGEQTKQAGEAGVPEMASDADVRNHLHCLAIARLLLERIHEVLQRRAARQFLGAYDSHFFNLTHGCFLGHSRCGTTPRWSRFTGT